MDMTRKVSRAMIERFCRRYQHNSTVQAAIRMDTGHYVHERQIARIRGSMSIPRTAHAGFTHSGAPLEPIGDTKQATHQDMMRRGSDMLLQAIVREHLHYFGMVA